jgi:hypothetical protein
MTPPILDSTRLDRVDAEAFRHGKPFPFVEIEGALTPEGYGALLAELPDPAKFTAVFGRKRKYGQASHDRFAMQYRPWANLPGPWARLMAEIKGPAYRRFLARLFGRDDFLLHAHWHYTPTGCTVSPHCDAPWKLGSHIFYLNTERDWDPAWGGATLILDDDGRFPANSAPGFADFREVCSSGPVGNRSLVFMRDGNSWHGVTTLRCPEGALRKVFIVEVRERTAVNAARTALGF